MDGVWEAKESYLKVSLEGERWEPERCLRQREQSGEKVLPILRLVTVGAWGRW